MLLAGVETLHDLPSMFLAAADKVHKKTNLSDDLTNIASDQGLIISENQASGNCMFYAVSVSHFSFI